MRKHAEDLISVIVPMYNAEETIERCVKSIQLSTYGNLEIILVDDESQDKTVQICEELKAKDSRIKIFTKKNSGAGETRSFGLEKAKGIYVAFVDSDDWIEPQMYEKLYERILHDNVDVCFCGYYAWDVLGDQREEPMRFDKMLYEGVDILRDVIHNTVWFASSKMKESSLVGVWRGLYSMKLIRNHNIKFLSERRIYSEDSLFNLEFLCYSKRVGVVSDCYYNHIRAEGTLTTTSDSRYERMNDWYHYVICFSKEQGICKYVTPYLNTQYLRELRKNINEVIHEKDIAERYNLIKADYRYTSTIRIMKIKGCGLKERLRLGLLLHCKWFYIVLQRKRMR